MTTKVTTRTKTRQPHGWAYARISDDQGKLALGVERQTEDMTEMADEDGIPSERLHLYLKDNDRSASAYATKPRPDFVRFTSDLETKTQPGDRVFLDDLSRYTRERDTGVITRLIEICTVKRLHLKTSMGGDYDVTLPDTVNRMHAEANGNAAYSAFISFKVRRKKRHKVKKGEPTGGSRCFGYAATNIAPLRKAAKSKAEAEAIVHTLTIVEAEADSIRVAIADLLAGTTTLVSIADRWNISHPRTDHARSKAQRWSAGGVKIVLTNPTIAGLLTASRMEIVVDDQGRIVRGADGKALEKRTAREIVGKGNWPEIITEDQHRSIVNKLNDPNRKKRQPARRSLLTGFVVCGVCGTPMNRDKTYYKCLRFPDRHVDACGHNVVASDLLDEHVSGMAVAVLKDSRRLAKKLRLPKHAPKPVGEDPATVQRELDELAETHGRGELPGGMRTFIAMGKVIEARLDAARSAQAEVEDDDVSVLRPFVEGDAVKLWEAADLDAKRAILRALFDAIVIRKATKPGYGVDIGRRIEDDPSPWKV